MSSILTSLKATFGVIPLIIEQNLRYFIYNDSEDDFTCIPCNKIIQKVNNNKSSTTKNFEKHLLSAAHRNNTVPLDFIENALNVTFEGKIPQVVLNNLFVLGMEDGSYTCEICDKIIKQSKYSSVTENNFSYHLLTDAHENKLKAYNNSLEQLHNVYGGIPGVILNNSKFLRRSRSGKSYFCTLCEEQLHVYTYDYEQTEDCFKTHLNCIEHVENVKEANGFSRLPELKSVYQNRHLPCYVRRSIEYLSMNGTHFFCSLCSENIQLVHHDVYKTEQNLKLHTLSSTHLTNLEDRRDLDNDAFAKLTTLFKEFSDEVLKNLLYITLIDGDFGCTVCEEFIVEEDSDNDMKWAITNHFESSGHENKTESEVDRQHSLVTSLSDIFGEIPTLIQENIEHIEYKGKNRFECALCSEKLQVNSRANVSITQEIFEKHLESFYHNNQLEMLETRSEELKTGLYKIFDYIPQFVKDSWKHICFDEDNEDFHCNLCKKDITVNRGTKWREITQQSFKNHFLSNSHLMELKKKANNTFVVSEQLTSVFGRVPNFILSNLVYVYEDERGFYCIKCDARLSLGKTIDSSENNFYKHLSGSCHMAEVRDIETNKKQALESLDWNMFWRVPEFLLRNLDHLESSTGDDLFCILCQDTLHIDNDDLDYSKELLRCHFDGEVHKYNLSIL